MESEEKLLEHYTDYLSGPGRQSDGSYTRLPFSPEYFETARRLTELMEAEGLQVSQDAVGNVFGLRKGSGPDAKKIVTGSHLDSVKNGGKYDGILGVASSLLAVHRMNEEGVTLRDDLVVSGLQGEEGSPLGGTFGSRTLMGLVPEPDAEYAKVLKDFGIDYDAVRSSHADTSMWKEYLELHIEQGKILESNHIDIGVVKGIVGITRYRIVVEGEANHAGTTPMDRRRDALVAASELVLYISRHAREAGGGFVATVGSLTVEPGAPTIIPGKVSMVLEMRDMSQQKIDHFLADVRKYAEGIETGKMDSLAPGAACAVTGAVTDGLEKAFRISFHQMVQKASVTCSGRIDDVIRNCCGEAGFSCRDMQSGAGHDSNAFGTKVPCAMIFVPSRGGFSHCREEYTSYEDAAKGADVLYRTICAEGMIQRDGSLAAYTI